MGERALDCIGIPLAAFVQHRGSGRAPAVRGHFFRRIPHPAKGLVDRVLAHRALEGVEGWEDEPGWTGQCVQFVEAAKHLVREWNGMRLAHLHPTRRDRPDGRIEVELAPVSLSQFTRSAHHMRGYLHGDAGDHGARIFVDRPEQFTYGFGFGQS